MSTDEKFAHMWRWEDSFYGSVMVKARSLFKRLDPELDPDVHVIGIRINPPEGTLKAVVLSHDHGLPSEPFVNILSEADSLAPHNPLSQLRQSHPVQQERQDSSIYRRAIKDAVAAALQPFDMQDGMVSFVSIPIIVSDWDRSHYVLVVVRLQQSRCSLYSSLKQDTVHIHEYRTADIPTSLIDATAREFLRACERILKLREPGSELEAINLDSDDILRAAGNRLMTVPEWKGEDQSYVGILYRACVEVAMMRYEGAETRGYVIISPRSHTHIQFAIQFVQPIRLTSKNRKIFRKLLESTSTEHSLIVDAEHIHGFGHIADSYNESEETLFEIRFDTNGKWILRHAGSELMRVRYGQPELAMPKVPLATIDEAIRSISPEISEDGIVPLRQLITDLSENGHGALLVISSIAADEALRLQAFRTNPFTLSKDTLAVTTSIDGAVLIDVLGMCHAFGVILDGIAVEGGDPGRGSRYNSAVRYLDSSPGKAIAIVVSEDGYVDVLQPSNRNLAAGNA